MLPGEILVIRNPATLPRFVYGTVRACIRKRFRFRVFASIDPLSTIHWVSETCSTFTLPATAVLGTFAVSFCDDTLELGGGTTSSERRCSMVALFLDAVS